MPFGPTKPSERTQLVERHVTYDSSPISQGLQGFQNFFSNQLNVQQKKDIETNRINNQVALAGLEQKARLDPETLAESARTGDYTPFVGLDRASDVAFQMAASQVVGKLQAANNTSSYQKLVDGLGPNEDASSAVSTRIGEDLQGMDPRVSNAYADAIDKAVNPMLGKRATRIKSAQVAQLTSNITPYVKSLLESGSIATVDDYNEASAEYARAYPGGEFTKKAVESKLLFDEQLLRMSARGDAIGQKAMEIAERAGVMERVGQTKANKLRNEAANALKLSLNENHSLAAADYTDALQAWTLEGSGDPQPLHQMFLRQQGIMLAHGPRDNPALLKMRKQHFDAIKDNAEAFKIVKSLRGGKNAPPTTDKVRDDAIKMLEKRKPVDALRLQAQQGASADNKQKWSQTLLGGGQDLIGTVRSLSTLNKTSKLPMTSFLDTGNTVGIFHALEAILETEGDQAVTEKHGQLLEGLKSGEKIDGHFERRLRDSSGRARGGTASVRDTVKSIADSFTSQELKQFGLPEDFSFKTMGRGMQVELERSLDVASLLSAGSPGDTVDTIKALAKKSLKGRYEMDVNRNGDSITVARRTPSKVKNLLGQVVEMEPFGQKHADLWRERMSEMEAATDVDFPDFATKTDDLSARDGTRAVMIDGNEFAFAPGTYRLSEQQAAILGPMLLGAIKHSDGSVTGTLLPPNFEAGDDGTAGLQFSHSATFDGSRGATGQWRVRYASQPDPDLEQAGGVFGAIKAVGEFFGLSPDINKEQIFKDAAALDADRRGPARALLLEHNVQFWTDEKLNRSTTRRDPAFRNAIADEKLRRAEGGARRVFSDVSTLPPGFSLATPMDNTYEPDDKSQVERDKAVQSIEDEGLRTGVYTPHMLDDLTDEPETLEGRITRRDQFSMHSGSMMEDMTGAPEQQFFHRLATFVAEREGYRSFAYSERTGKKYNPKTDGKDVITVGFGYNTDRPEAKAEMASAGLDRTKVRAHKQLVSRTQATQLMQLATEKNFKFLRKEFVDTPMEAHRWQALLSMVYSSRWKGGRPTLIGPAITKAIKEQDWERATFEILNRSAGGVLPNQVEGIKHRRRMEALLFTGALEEDTLEF